MRVPPVLLRKARNGEARFRKLTASACLFRHGFQFHQQPYSTVDGSHACLFPPVRQRVFLKYWYRHQTSLSTLSEVSLFPYINVSGSNQNPGKTSLLKSRKKKQEFCRFDITDWAILPGDAYAEFAQFIRQNCPHWLGFRMKIAIKARAAMIGVSKYTGKKFPAIIWHSRAGKVFEGIISLHNALYTPAAPLLSGMTDSEPSQVFRVILLSPRLNSGSLLPSCCWSCVLPALHMPVPLSYTRLNSRVYQPTYARGAKGKGGGGVCRYSEYLALSIQHKGITYYRWLPARRTYIYCSSRGIGI